MKNLEDNFTQKYIKYKTKYLTTLSLHSKGGDRIRREKLPSFLIQFFY